MSLSFPIYSGAFGDGSSLLEIALEDGQENFQSLDGVLFNSDFKTLLQFPGGKVGHSIVSEIVNRIDD